MIIYRISSREKFLNKKLKVIGVDSFDNYYDVSLKKKN